MNHFFEALTKPVVVRPASGSLGPDSYENPFVELPLSARYAVICFFVVWRVLPDLAGALQLEEVSAVLSFGRFFASSLLNLLLLAPFFMARFAGTPIGWLHPMVLPTFLTIVRDLINIPNPLLFPVLAWLAPPTIPDYFLLQTASAQDRVSVELKRDVLLILAQVSYYIGFALPVIRRNSKRYTIRWVISDIRMIAVVAASIGVFVYFVEVNGGLAVHFSALALGRFQMRESSGHLLLVIGLMPYLVLMWFAFRPMLVRRLWFICLFCLATGAQFVATGSRSSILFPLVSMAAIWIWTYRRLPVFSLLVLLLIPFFALGVLGDIRNISTADRDQINVKSVLGIDFEQASAKTSEELAVRKILSGEIAIVQKVPDEVPYLYGMSYVSIVSFLIPRSLWPEKPRGPGAYVAAVIFEGLPDTVGYEGASYPTGGMGEAYWNFGIAGIICAYLIFGAFHRFVVEKVMQQPMNPFIGFFMVMACVVLVDVDSDSVIGFLQRVIPLYFVFLFVCRAVVRPQPIAG